VSVIHAPERGSLSIPGPAPRLLLIQAPYYEQVVAGMRTGAQRLAAESGATLEVVDVAGGYELPAALRMALQQQATRYDGFLLLGCVVKGETDHYQFICDAICHGVMAIGAETGAAIGFGLLTVDTLAQALARSGADKHNKGAEAMHALLMQVALRRRWGLGA
jgi:6,7-dimethyl-8-ribityllumazine synthase